MDFIFNDRLGNKVNIKARIGETIANVLMKSHIPPASVIVMKDEKIVSDSHYIQKEATYDAHLIEGYDISSIQRLYRDLYGEEDRFADNIYRHRHLFLEENGGVDIEFDDWSFGDFHHYVEEAIIDTCKKYYLIEKGDKVLIGLSGGVDSSSLAIALTSIRDRIPEHDIIAVTFEDNDSGTSTTFQHAKNIASSLGIEYHLAPASMAGEIFGLKIPLHEIMTALMETEYAHYVMYIDHHTTRRVLEVFSDKIGATKICLGLHTTDLVAGLMNAWMTGYDVASLPRRDIDKYTYIYPLAFQQKRALHIYHYIKVGSLARHTYPNQWEHRPLDRNFYYYLSEILQYFWPGIEYQLFSAHKWRLRRTEAQKYTHCPNCGSALLHQPFTQIAYTECDVCHVFKKMGYIG